MWCDDFDGDLYKLVPEAREVIAPAASIRLYTTCPTTDGQINHPTCWEMHGEHVCFLGFEDRAPQPSWCSSGWPVVACTFEEVMRDLWCHHLAARVRVGDEYKPLLWGHVPPGYFPDEGDGEGPVWMLYQVFNALLHHARGHRVLNGAQVELRKRSALDRLRMATQRIHDFAREHELLRGGMPA